MAINAYQLGTGFIALKDTNGNAYPVGTVESWDLDGSSEVTELMGGYKMPLLTADTGRKVKVSVKFSTYSSALIDVMWSGSSATGSRWISTKAKTASTSTFTVANTDDSSPAGWAFVSDLGVTYASTGQPLKYNSGTLAAGEYKNTAGAYTLHTDDASANVNVTYLWSQTAGSRTTFSNTAVGLSTYFAAYLQMQTTQANGTVRKFLFEFPAILIPTLKLGSKNNAFLSQDVELSVCCDSSGVWAYRSDI